MSQAKRTITLADLKGVIESIKEIRQNIRNGHYALLARESWHKHAPYSNAVNELLKRTDELGLTDSQEMYRQGNWAYGETDRHHFRRYHRIEHFDVHAPHIKECLNFVYNRAAAHIASVRHPIA